MSTPADASPLPEACPNCGAPVFGPYCAQCGQETVISKLTLREFGHEYLQSFVTLEGRLWRTLWLLVRHPGRLTVEFLAGRRRRYVRPLPLYFSISFVLFLVMALFPAQLVQRSVDDAPPPGLSFGDKVKKQSPVSITTGPDQRSGSAKSKPFEDENDWPQLLRPLVARVNANSERLNSDPDYGAKRLSSSFVAKLPYAVFALVPMFALSTRLVYWRRRRGYAEHFLFALHLHCFLFLSMLAVYGLSDGWMPTLLAPLWMVYLVLALRTMFGGRLWPQIMRALLLALMHNIVLGVVMLLVLALSFLGI